MRKGTRFARAVTKAFPITPAPAPNGRLRVVGVVVNAGTPLEATAQALTCVSPLGEPSMDRYVVSGMEPGVWSHLGALRVLLACAGTGPVLLATEVASRTPASASPLSF